MSQQGILNLLISSPPHPAGRPLSHGSTEGSSDRSSPLFEERQDDFVPPEDDAILKQTTVVVKAVMELSNKVPLSRPSDYVEFVKVRVRVRVRERERRRSDVCSSAEVLMFRTGSLC